MAWRFGLVLACLLGCGDGGPPPDPGPLEGLTARSVASFPADEVLAIALAGVDTRRFVVASARTQGQDFCPDCLDPSSTDCGATCRRAVLEVAQRRTDAPGELSYRFHEVFPRSREHAVGGIEVVALDETRAGVAWLDCDRATCGAAQPRESCTAFYTTIDLATGQRGAIAQLYDDAYGDLALAYDARARRLLAILSRPASGAGVRAAVFDHAGAPLVPWQPYGGAAARAPAAIAGPAGFMLVADDPAPGLPAAPAPCADACDCAPPAVADQATGGLYAFWPGVARPAERIAPGRVEGGAYGAREASTAIEAGGRLIVASSQAPGGMVELFEAAPDGWLRRHASPAPAQAWLGVLGDGPRLAWLGAEPDPDVPGESPDAPEVPATPNAPDAPDAPTGRARLESDEPRRLVVGVVLGGDAEQRGPLLPLGTGPVLDVAPVGTGGAVTSAFLLHGAAPRRFEVLAISTGW